jgi:hypothetical protein
MSRQSPPSTSPRWNEQCCEVSRTTHRTDLSVLVSLIVDPFLSPGALAPPHRRG